MEMGINNDFDNDGEKDSKILRQKKRALVWNLGYVFIVLMFLYAFFVEEIENKEQLSDSSSDSIKKNLHGLRKKVKNLKRNIVRRNGNHGEAIESFDNSFLPPNSLYRVSNVADRDGALVSLGKYSGMISLIVNVACKWGKTERTYRELIDLQNKFSSKGFTVLAFPTNEFNQELGSNEEIKAFLQEHFPNLNFPVFGLSESLQSNPVYKNLAEQMPAKDIKWNFYKYLIDRKGQAIAFYDKKQFPMTENGIIISDIEKLLEEQPYSEDDVQIES